MSGGRLIAVVGPSGVGKDSVMLGLASVLPELHMVRRVITRAPDLGGENYDAVTEAEFFDMVRDEAFALHWSAHGLFYGIPIAIKSHFNDGTDCLVNLSRGALAEASDIFPKLIVFNITATPEILAKRLTHRARETDQEIARRIAAADKPLPAGLNVIHLSNDGPLTDTIANAARYLQPVRS